MAAKAPAQRPESWPIWYDGKHINEVLFCHDFLTRHPMRCVNGTLFTVDGPVINEELVKHQIVKVIQDCITTGLSKRAASLLEAVKIQAYAEPFPVEHDRIHCANGIYHLNGTFEPVKVFCANRLAVSYNPAAASPQRWLTFLSELLEADDIPTLQEYMGYCLIPTTKGQQMLFLVGKGGEGKSRIGVVLMKLLGHNMNTGSIAKVETSPFARADLEHELLMLDDDLKLEALPQTNNIKAIITAELPMDLEKKGQQSYQGDLYVRFIGLGNGTLQSLYDRSLGFFRRQIISQPENGIPTGRTIPSSQKRCAPKRKASSCGVWRVCTGSSPTTTASPSAHGRSRTWRMPFQTGTTSSTFWNRKGTSNSVRTAGSVPTICTKCTNAGVPTMNWPVCRPEASVPG